MCGDTAQYFVFFAEFDNDEPCDGAVPLVNEATGQDYNCLPKQDECPSGSYCHITPLFAKCCKLGMG